MIFFIYLGFYYYYFYNRLLWYPFFTDNQMRCLLMPYLITYYLGAPEKANNKLSLLIYSYISIHYKLESCFKLAVLIFYKHRLWWTNLTTEHTFCTCNWSGSTAATSEIQHISDWCYYDMLQIMISSPNKSVFWTESSSNWFRLVYWM